MPSDFFVFSLGDAEAFVGAMRAPVGVVVLRGQRETVTEVSLEENGPERLVGRFDCGGVPSCAEIWSRAFVDYFDGLTPYVDLPYGVMAGGEGGTVFQRRVWQALRAIPFGARVSYAELARAVNQPSAVRAVAAACGANRLALVFPCHRVGRKSGALGGYRWGVESKRRLLAWESACCANVKQGK